MESIRKYKNNDEIIKDLEARGLIFPDEKSKQIFKSYLMQYGYFAFVKKMSNDLMYSNVDNKIFKKEFTSNNLRYLFDIDRNNSAIIFKYFRNIEFLLNTSLLKVIAKKLNKNAKCPYIAALDDKGLDDIFPKIHENMSINKRWENNSYVNLYHDLFKNFNNIDFDCREAIKDNKDNEKEEIIKLIEKGWFKNFLIKPLGKAAKKDWEYLDIFSLFQILTFSQLVRIFTYLSTSLKNEVIKEFFNDFKPSNKYSKLKEDSFNVLIKIFSDLRNLLMHNGCLMKFNFNITNDIKENFEQYFNISIPEPNIKLNEAILIMESIIDIKNKMFKEINELAKIKFAQRTNRNDKVSNLIFEIIEVESRIKIDLTL